VCDFKINDIVVGIKNENESVIVTHQVVIGLGIDGFAHKVRHPVAHALGDVGNDDLVLALQVPELFDDLRGRFAKSGIQGKWDAKSGTRKVGREKWDSGQEARGRGQKGSENGAACTHAYTRRYHIELDKEVAVLLREPAACVCPPGREQLLMEDAQLGNFLGAINAGIIFNCVQAAKNEVENADGRPGWCYLFIGEEAVVHVFEHEQ
jgi:hypothetical protein